MNRKIPVFIIIVFVLVLCSCGGWNDGCEIFGGMTDDYIYAKEVAEQIPVLEIFSLYDNPTVRQTIGLFQLQTGVSVNFTIGMDGVFNPTPEDLIRVLDTQILADKSPDIIVLDGMPFEAYMESGLLHDISKLSDSLVSSGNLMENLGKTYTLNGKAYGVPTRYNLPVMIGAPSLLAEINSLSDLAALVFEHQSAENEFFYTPDNLYGNRATFFWNLHIGAFDNRYYGRNFLMNLYDIHASRFITTERAIDEDALESYLTEVFLVEQVLKSYKPKENFKFRDNLICAPGVYERVSGGVELTAAGEVQIDVFTLIGRQGLAWLFGTAGITDDITLAPIFNQPVYFPVGGLSILSSSGHKDLAEQFIQLALSIEVQGITLGDGFPANRRALSDVLESLRRDFSNESDFGFIDIVDSMSEPVFVDLIVKTAVENQAEAVSNGDVTPAEGVNRIVNAIRTYLIK